MKASPVRPPPVDPTDPVAPPVTDCDDECPPVDLSLVLSEDDVVEVGALELADELPEMPCETPAEPPLPFMPALPDELEIVAPPARVIPPVVLLAFELETLLPSIN